MKRCQDVECIAVPVMREDKTPKKYLHESFVETIHKKSLEHYISGKCGIDLRVFLE